MFPGLARYFVFSPEQTRYTTELAQQPDDPQRVQEIYVFLPSLRRSLRLSSAARCSPILGSDWVQDDHTTEQRQGAVVFNRRPQ